MLNARTAHVDDETRRWRCRTWRCREEEEAAPSGLWFSFHGIQLLTNECHINSSHASHARLFDRSVQLWPSNWWMFHRRSRWRHFSVLFWFHFWNCDWEKCGAADWFYFYLENLITCDVRASSGGRGDMIIICTCFIVKTVNQLVSNIDYFSFQTFFFYEFRVIENWKL